MTRIPFSAIVPIVGGYMPSYPSKKIWDKFQVGLVPDYLDFIRSVDLFRLVPYFWEKEIYLDLGARCLKGRLKATEIWDYKWELCGIDDTVIKSGEDTIKLESSKMWWREIWANKRHAISLGYLSPNKHYRVFVTFTKSGANSTRELLATFTVKDKDEMKSQLFILIFGIVLTLILTSIFK